MSGCHISHYFQFRRCHISFNSDLTRCHIPYYLGMFRCHISHNLISYFIQCSTIPDEVQSHWRTQSTVKRHKNAIAACWCQCLSHHPSLNQNWKVWSYQSLFLHHRPAPRCFPWLSVAQQSTKWKVLQLLLKERSVRTRPRVPALHSNRGAPLLPALPTGRTTASTKSTIVRTSSQTILITYIDTTKR